MIIRVTTVKFCALAYRRNNTFRLPSIFVSGAVIAIGVFLLVGVGRK